jgi:hypothetical protein
MARQALERLMSTIRGYLFCGLVAAFFVLFANGAEAYTTYTAGCDNCHGDFTGPTSLKGSVFPGDDKHRMHRSSSEMDADCSLCHTSIGDDPFIGSSLGTANNTGYGCVGCHGRLEDGGNDGGTSSGYGAGLRQRHDNSGITSCAFCHQDADPANYTPVGEHVMPPYYGTVDSNVDMPCNATQSAKTNENWTVGDFVGLDNDGDLDFDFNDSDCAPPALKAPLDFDGDGKSDIFWRHSTNGDNWLFIMDSATIATTVGVSAVPNPTVWKVAGNGDYNGDGSADILWRNEVTGQNHMYLMDGPTVFSSVSVSTVPNPGMWKVVGNGDYDGDGNADILWRNNVSGQNHMHLMDGGTITSSLSVTTVPDPDNWKVVGNGDYDGDGKSDILWRNATTGQNHMYLMNGASVSSSLKVTTVPNPDDWQVAASGDYNADGKSDILWRNATTGQNHMYLMNGATVESSLIVTTVPSPDDWKVMGSGDYNDDGMSDIFWRNISTGENWMYLMDSARIDSSLSVTTVSDTLWEVVVTP